MHVFVHGGYWSALDETDFSFVARAFQPAGVLVAVINYGLRDPGRPLSRAILRQMGLP